MGTPIPPIAPINSGEGSLRKRGPHLLRLVEVGAKFISPAREDAPYAPATCKYGRTERRSYTTSSCGANGQSGQPAACRTSYLHIDSGVADLVPPLVFWQPGSPLR